MNAIMDRNHKPNIALMFIRMNVNFWPQVYIGALLICIAIIINIVIVTPELLLFELLSALSSFINSVCTLNTRWRGDHSVVSVLAERCFRVISPVLMTAFLNK